MEEVKRRKRTVVAAIAGMACLALIAGSFAYWNQTSTVENPFDTSKYGSTIREDFKPSEGEDWQPGVKVDKSVTAVNTGDGDLIVRARLDEVWKYKSDATANPGMTYKTIGGTDVYTTSQADADDGKTAADGSIVEKNFNTATTNWVDGGDGWYYYKVNLTGGQSTDNWLESVELIDDADMGLMETTKYVSASTDPDEANWVWFTYTGSMPKYIDASGNACAAGDAGAQQVLHNKSETTYAKEAGVDLLGYSQSDYTLTVTLETVQPTKEALNEVFGGGSTFNPPAGTAWALKD